jgi:hypothetical protein
MAVESFEKTPEEEWSIICDIVNNAAAGESITSVTLEATDTNGDPADVFEGDSSGSWEVESNGVDVTVYITGGTVALSPYMLRVIMDTDAGNTFVKSIKMKIKQDI